MQIMHSQEDLEPLGHLSLLYTGDLETLALFAVKSPLRKSLSVPTCTSSWERGQQFNVAKT